MTRFAFLMLLIAALITVACSDRKSIFSKKNLIPEKELVTILKDIHLADGLLVLPKINSWANSLDSITSYYHIIEKHGYTKEMMDKTMAYYFINNPKKLSKIYDQVLGILSEMESQTEKKYLDQYEQDSNQWPGRDYYASPSLSDTASARFDLIIRKEGYYVLSYSATFFPDDQSSNTGLTVYLVPHDSINTGKKLSIASISYLKDGRPHDYRITIRIPDNKNLCMSGWLYDNNNINYDFENHFCLENISLTFSPI